MPRKRGATPPSLPGDPAGPGWRAGLGVGTSLRSSDASAEVVGKLAGGTGGGALVTPERKSYESWILGRMDMENGSATSSMAHSFAIQHNSYRYLQGLASFEALKISQARHPPALAKQGRGCVY
jgi:hypothetical protein